MGSLFSKARESKPKARCRSTRSWYSPMILSAACTHVRSGQYFAREPTQTLSTPIPPKIPVNCSLPKQKNETRKSVNQLSEYSKIEIEPHKPKKGPPTRSLFR